MEKRLMRQQLLGALFVLVTGTALHFVYGWSGGHPVAGALSAVNESVWEHMKLVFVPLFFPDAGGGFFPGASVAQLPGVPGNFHTGGYGPGAGAVLYLHGHRWDPHPVGGHSGVHSGGPGRLRSGGAAAAPGENGGGVVSGSGAAGAVGAGFPVCAVDLPATPAAAVSGPADLDIWSFRSALNLGPFACARGPVFLAVHGILTGAALTLGGK